MNQRAVCPYCGERVAEEAVRLWDGRTYCRSCVEVVSPELYQFAIEGGELVDVLDESDVSIKNFFEGAGYKTLIVMFFIFMLPFVLMSMGDQDNGKFNVLIGFCLFWSGLLVGWSILKGLLRMTRRSLPRTVSVAQGELRITTLRNVEVFPLEECHWKYGWTMYDPHAKFAGLMKAIMIETAESRFSCGYSIRMRKYWRAFLLLGGIRHKSYRFYLRTLLITVAGLLGGLLLGYCAGDIVARATNEVRWRGLLSFLGLFDCGGIAFNYAYYTGYGRTAAHQRMSPLIWGSIYFIGGLKIFFIGGLEMKLLASSLNAVAGALVAWSFRRFLTKNDTADDDNTRVLRELQKAL